MKKRLKILLIAPVMTIQPWNRGLQPPLGLLYLGTVATSMGHKVLVRDLNLLRQHETTVSKIVKEFRPDIVGITVYTINFPQAITIAEVVKKCNKQTKVFIGGPHITLSYLGGCEFTNFSFVDGYVVGEGEKVFEFLLKLISEGEEDFEGVQGVIIANQQDNIAISFADDLDALPFPDYTLLPCLSAYDQLVMITSRGCPSKCSFCASRLIWGSIYRERSAENVLEELRFHIKKLGRGGFDISRKIISFVDDTFLVNKNRVEKFCEYLLKYGLNIRWQCEARVLDIVNTDPNLLKLMKVAGCTSILLGIESSSGDTLSWTHKPSTPDLVIEAIETLKENGIRVVGTFVIGFPWEKEADMIQTFNFAMSLELDACSCSFATFFPGTPLYKKYAKVYRENFVYDVELYNYEFSIPKMTKKDDVHKLNVMLNLQRLFYQSPYRTFSGNKYINSNKPSGLSACLFNRR